MRPRSGFLAVAGSLATALLAACDPATAPPPTETPTYDLVFVARVRGIDELWRMPLAGGAPQPLLTGTVSAWHPAPSPDGRRVAYVDIGDGEIWVAPVGGAPDRNVSRYDADIDVSPAWSPDGARIAFTSSRTGGTDVYVVAADGSGLTNLMPNEFPAAPMDESPAWSPDGTHLAFASDRAGSGHKSIWIMRADGTGLRRLTASTSARDYEPSWSPDGRRIVFRRVSTEGGPLRTDLAIVGVDGTGLVELRQPGTERHPSWSPDGAWIAFTSDRTGGESRLFTIRPDGSEVVERAGGTAFGRHVMHPHWIRR